MNLNINPNYQSTNFRAKYDFSKISKLLGGAVTLAGVGYMADKTVNKENGMSAEELNGRIMTNPINTNPDLFNPEVAYNYFANGKLKNFPEYVEEGKERIANLDDYDKENRLNTLKYQEQIVDKILSEDALINNQSIRNNLYRMTSYGYNWHIPDNKNDSLYQYLEDQTQERLKVLDAYAKSEQLQQNPIINKRIANFACYVGKEGMGDFLIEMLEKNANNTDDEFFSNLEGLVLNNIDTDLIRKVQSDKKLYDRLGSYTLYETGGTNKEKAEKMIKIIDNYLEKYADSEFVTQKLSNILWSTFITNYEEKDEVAFAVNMMKELADREKLTKSETAGELCDKINTILNDLLSGNYNDKNKTDLENVNKQIDIIRDLRGEIKKAASKYTDEDSKKALSWTLGTVIARLDLMKQVREKIGWGIIGFAELTDDDTNKEIFEMLK